MVFFWEKKNNNNSSYMFFLYSYLHYNHAYYTS